MDFPVLEVLAARTGPPPGTRLPLRAGAPLRFGREAESEVRLETPHVSRRHCLVVRELDRWWLRDLGSANGVRVHGAQVQEEELTHGTVFEVGRGYVYEFLARERGEIVEPSMEAAIRSRPDDERQWSVYADWLQEHGAPLGEALSTAGDAPGSAAWLGPFAGDFARGELQVSWWRGVPRRLVLRSLQGELHDWTWEHHLAALHRAPGLRFVREVELDLASFLRADVAEEAPVRRVVDAIGDTLPMLERLIISPARIFATSRLSARFEVQLRPWRAATVTLTALRPLCAVRLEFEGAGREPRELELGNPHPLFMRTRVEVQGAVQRTVRFSENGDLWEVERAAGGPPGLMHLNGVAIGRAFVRSGDVIEIVPGVGLLFSA